MDSLTLSPSSCESPPLQSPTAKQPAAKKRRMSPAIGRIQNGAANKGKRRTSKPKKPTSMKRVDELLRSLGVEDTRSVSCCLKAGILHGHVRLLPPEQDHDREYGLDQVLLEGECPVCGEQLMCPVRDALCQSDYGGSDYESGGDTATFKCNSSECDGMGLYITDICEGSPKFDTGKFHNHCTKCPKFGVCLGDYRETHGHKAWVYIGPQ